MSQMLLEGLALGDVTHCRNADTLSLVGERFPPDLQVQTRAVLAQAHGLVWLLKVGKDVLAHLVAIGGCDELENRPANHFRRRMPEDIEKGLVYLQDHAPVADDGEAFESRVGQASGLLLSKAQFLLP